MGARGSQDLRQGAYMYPAFFRPAYGLRPRLWLLLGSDMQIASPNK